jgi:hypothetical protein
MVADLQRAVGAVSAAGHGVAVGAAAAGAVNRTHSLGSIPRAFIFR